MEGDVMLRYGEASNTEVLDFDSRLYRETLRPIYWGAHRAEEPLTKFFIDRLGPPAQHWVGGSERRRFLIWHYDPVYILVHNVKGICVEALHSATVEEIDAAIRSFEEDMRLEELRRLSSEAE